MALNLSSPAARSAGALLLIAVVSGALAGCEPNGPGSKQTFNDTEKVKVTEVVIDGGDGTVNVHTSPINDTRIKRVVQSRGSDVGNSYRLDGTVLHVDTTCGFQCDVSYDVNAPVGVKVRGELSSGDVSLTDVAGADVKVTSGSVTVTRATGDITAAVTSGDLTVTDVKGTTRLVATSGDVKGRTLRGPVNVEATSGNVDLELATVTSVTTRVNSGDVTLGVPTGPYRLDVSTKSGDQNVGITATSGAASVLDVSADSGNVTIRPI
jgi:hypothetical protein